MNKIVHQADALVWLKENSIPEGASFITSLPDFSEFPRLNLQQWKEWLIHAASLVLRSCADQGVVIFYQRDSKLDGEWVDKGYLCQRAAEATGHHLVWHKIVCRAPPGQTTFGRPAYSHLLCFSRLVRPAIGISSPDVLVTAGKSTWTRGMGENACRAACSFIKENTDSETIIDPFCGHGLVLAIANEMGFDAIGVELSRKRAERARAL